jgi:hypothetical protein
MSSDGCPILHMKCAILQMRASYIQMGCPILITLGDADGSNVIWFSMALHWTKSLHWQDQQLELTFIPPLRTPPTNDTPLNFPLALSLPSES